MEICAPHFETVTNAIRIRALWDLQLHAPEEKNALIRWINGEQRPGDPTDLFDSLIAMQAILFQNALDVVGMSLMASDKCPLCEVAVRTSEGDVGVLVNAAGDQVLKAAIENGLVKVTMQ
jgi:hypothetical protein